MCRGYYIRCKAISAAVVNFIGQTDFDSTRQIISLGAGYDTTFFRLQKQGLMKNIKYFEVGWMYHIVLWM